MVRTADTAVRVGGKKGAPPPSKPRSKSPVATSTDRGGLNPICPRETPAWQKPITDFFRRSEKSTTAIKNTVQDIQMENDKISTCVEPIPHSSKDKSYEIKSDINDIEKNKENYHSTANNGDADIELNDINSSVMKNVNIRDDYDDDIDCIAPRKKIKLNEDVHTNLETREQALT